MKRYLERLQTEGLERALGRFPVVVLTGARQTGKTTLVQHLPSAHGRTFRSLDDLTTADLGRRDPQALLTEGPRLTLDEAQRMPELLLRIKAVVDANRTPGRFLLTGSANLLLMEKVSESLAGRASYVCLRPMTEAEKAGRPQAGPWSDLVRSRSVREALDRLPPGRVRAFDWAAAVREGGFPVAATDPDAEGRRAWFDAYVQTYVERDLRQLSLVSDLVDFRRLMRVAALRVGRLVNQAEMARDAGLSHATAHRYLNLLETSYLIARVPQYSVNRTRRLLKMPKLYWADTGLAATLAGVEDEASLSSHECRGGLLENLVWHHLRCAADASPRPWEVLTWRTVQGQEVDFVLESAEGLLPVEVKSSGQLSGDDLKGLDAFLKEYPDLTRFGVIVHCGRECRLVGSRILAIPLRAALGLATPRVA